MNLVCPRCRHGDHTRCAGDCQCQACAVTRAVLTALALFPTPCPVCGGAGIVDTSPPGVEERP